jgi:hypothetical protein
MDFFVSLLLKNWRLVLLGTVIASLAAFSWLQTSRLKSALEELSLIEVTANAAQAQTEANLETIQRAVPIMVEQAQTNAVRNYMDRHRSNKPDHVVCPVATGLRIPGGSGQVASATVTYEPTGELVAPDPEFIRACARDAGRLQLWQQLCTLNTQLCEVVK